jgi:hypothetical protein
MLAIFSFSGVECLLKPARGYQNTGNFLKGDFQEMVFDAKIEFSFDISYNFFSNIGFFSN